MGTQITHDPRLYPDQHCFREDNCVDHLDYQGPDCCCCGWLAESHSGCDCDPKPLGRI